MLSRHALKPYEDLTAVTWSEQLGRLLVASESDDRLLLVSTDGTIEADLALPGGQQEGLALDDAGNLWVADERLGLLRFDLSPEGARGGGRRRNGTGSTLVTSKFLILLATAALLAVPASAQTTKPESEPPPGWQVKPVARRTPRPISGSPCRGTSRRTSARSRTGPPGTRTPATCGPTSSSGGACASASRASGSDFETTVDPAFDEGDELKDAWTSLRLAKPLQVLGG